VLAFEIAGGVDAGRRFVEALTLHSHVANIGDVRSLAIHPASTTHSQGPDEDRLAAGVTPGLVRLAVGIEHIDDILADLDQGFIAAKGA
jgi:O-acetylhomoserine (thiol)-lyase